MKLFSKKTEEELPPLKFPEFPSEEEETPTPKYEPTMTPTEKTNIKEAVAAPAATTPSSKPTEDLNLPIRKPAIKKGPPPTEKSSMIEELPTIEKPLTHEEIHIKEVQKRGKTLFVKVEKYQEAMAKMDIAKEKLKAAEGILKKLDELKKEEDAELRSWNQDIEALKSKLMEVDKTLFE